MQSSRIWKGVDLYEAQHLAEEAAIIACAIREALDREGKTVALISPDQDLVRAVMASIQRWGIVVDSSLGFSALKRGSGILVDLIMEMIAHECSTEKTIGLLHHPYCKMGMARKDVASILQLLHRVEGMYGRTRTLEGLEKQLHCDSQTKSHPMWQKAQDLLQHIRKHMRALIYPKQQTFADRLTHFVAFTEYVEPRVWQTDEGKKIAEALLLLRGYSEILTDKMDQTSFVMILRSFLKKITYHPTYIQRSRVVILSPMEARLQRFDRVILGGLNEGVWPRKIANSPWLSRPMRRELGLISDELAVGLQAHDFSQAFGAQEVLMTRSLKRGEPCIAARWLSRFKVLMNKSGSVYDKEVFREVIKAGLTLLTGPDIPRYQQPTILPKKAVFPSSMSVTSLDLLMENPYIFYAEKILKLKPPTMKDTGDFYQERGIYLHDICENLVEKIEQHRHITKEDLQKIALEQLSEILIGATEISAMLRTIWRHKWAFILDRYIEQLLCVRAETQRIMAEASGELDLRGSLKLRGRADRLDIFRGGGVRIVDLKTGSLASKTDIKTMKASQLALLALMAQRGGFSGIMDEEIKEVGLYPLVHKTREDKKEVMVATQDLAQGTNADWAEAVESHLFCVVSPYMKGEQPYKALPAESRYLETWRAFTRSAEWSENG